MAGPWYVRSTDGDNGSDGLSWANAKATVAGAIAAASAGDTIYVSQAHSESTAAAVTLTFPGTTAATNKLLCVNDAAEPPTALATGGVVATSGVNSHINIAGDLYAYGVTFSAGASSNRADVQTGGASGNKQIFDTCTLALGNSNGSSRISLAYANNIEVLFRNCTFSFVAGAAMYWGTTPGATIVGGSLTAGTTTSIFVGNYGLLDVSGFDLSAITSTAALFNAGGTGGTAIIRNCKLPASWSGAMVTTGMKNCRYEMHNTDAGDTNYRLLIKDTYLTITSETTLVRSGGASDGTTPLSWKIATSASCGAPVGLGVTGEIVRWNETTGSAITVTVEILHDSATNLTDAEVWLEVMYLGTSGVPLGTWTSDRAADILATPADQATSSETWTTTGMTNPNTQKLSVTITPAEKGFIHARVCVAKASKTLYVCPRLEIT